MRDNLKDKILDGLEKCPETRDSDIKLLNWIFINYYPDMVSLNDQGEYVVRLIDLYKLPREDNVKRIRAYIQNYLHQFLPTNEEVRKQRKISEQEWRVYLAQM